MIANSDERFTLKANGSTLSSNNNSVNDFENLAGVNVTLGAEIVELRGWANSTTKWDNIILDGSTSILAGPTKVNPPTEEKINTILNKISQGENVTIKSLLEKKFNK